MAWAALTVAAVNASAGESRPPWTARAITSGSDSFQVFGEQSEPSATGTPASTSSRAGLRRERDAANAVTGSRTAVTPARARAA